MSDDFICSRQREETTSRISYKRQAEQDMFDEGPYRDMGKAMLESSGSCHHEGTKPTLYRCKCETRTVPTTSPTSTIRRPRVYAQPACAERSVLALQQLPGTAGDQRRFPWPHIPACRRGQPDTCLHPRSTRPAEHPRPQTRHRFLCCSAIIFHV